MTTLNTAIIGSGLSGLMLAKMIKRYRDPQAKIVIIEKEASIGGQYGSIDYGKNGVFDIGMHIFYESCIPEIDRLFTDLLPEEEWNILVGNHKDIAGIYVNGKLQIDTPYVDLRNLPDEKWGQYIAELFLAIKNENNDLPDNASAYKVLVNHFGKHITDEIFVPVLEKLYLVHPDQLSELATKFTTINRLAFFEKELIADLMKSAAIRSRICFPNQMEMPSYRSNSQRGFYPKKYGMFRVMETFRKNLEEEGVEFFTSHMVSKLNIISKKLTSVTITNQEGLQQTIPVKELFWTAGLPPLAKTLGVMTNDLPYDKKHTTSVYVNLLMDKVPEMGNLYYFYSFDKPFRAFRITNYAAYCPDASTGRGFPLCVEMWLQNEDSKEDEAIIAQTTHELKSYGVITENHKITFAKVEKHIDGGFPLPSVNNIAALNEINSRIAAMGVNNIVPTGVLTGKNIFFIKDVLIDAYNKVTGKKEKFVY